MGWHRIAVAGARRRRAGAVASSIAPASPGSRNVAASAGNALGATMGAIVQATRAFRGPSRALRAGRRRRCDARRRAARDFWRGAPDPAWPAALAAGVRLHRRVDVHTDAHPAVRAARALFVPPLRRYAGIALDVWFDHCSRASSSAIRPCAAAVRGSHLRRAGRRRTGTSAAIGRSSHADPQRHPGRLRRRAPWCGSSPRSRNASARQPRGRALPRSKRSRCRCSAPSSLWPTCRVRGRTSARSRPEPRPPVRRLVGAV